MTINMTWDICINYINNKKSFTYLYDNVFVVIQFCHYKNAIIYTTAFQIQAT